MFLPWKVLNVSKEDECDFRDMTKSFNEEGFIGMTIISGKTMELDDYALAS